ncbi:MAG: hypothetical protein KF688_10320 [Pirellulales bacterium]|nr:hypothetical protein [Pirellulales bacterium]
MNQSQRPSRLDFLLALLFVSNLCGMLGTYPLCSFATGLGKLAILSHYREFDLNGLINREAVDQFDNGRFAGEWTQIPDFLGAQAFRHVELAAVWISIAFGINLVFVTIAWMRVVQ